MARYIDADELIVRLLKLKVVTDDMYGMGIARGIERAETAIQMQPTADVVPKSEVESMSHKCEDCAGCTQWKCDCSLIEENAKTEVAREIFEEIEDVLNNIGYLDEIDFKALKKKYTEDINHEN